MTKRSAEVTVIVMHAATKQLHNKTKNDNLPHPPLGGANQTPIVHKCRLVKRMQEVEGNGTTMTKNLQALQSRVAELEKSTTIIENSGGGR